MDADFKKEVVKYIPSLQRFALKLTGGDHARADDMVQDTMVRALKAHENFMPGTNMSAWLTTILRNNFRTNYRYRRVRHEVEWDPDLSDSYRLSTTGEVETEAEASFDFGRLLQYIACLRTDHRDALVAAGYLGLSYEDAAARLDVPVGTIKSRLNRARETLTLWIKEGVVQKVDLGALQQATKKVPASDPYFPIAQAYEDLFAHAESVGTVEHKADAPIEKYWKDLVASGALDDEEEFSSARPFDENL